MEVRINNENMAKCINLLDKLSLKGKESRHRTKLSVKLSERLEEVAKDEQEVKKEHCELDDDGKFVVLEGNKLNVLNEDGLRKDLRELYDEEYVIEGGNAQGFLNTVKKVLKKAENEWEGEEAYTYNYLCDAFDVDDENESEEKTEGDAE